MKECTCTIGFRELRWEETLKILSRIGFRFIEGSAEIPDCHLNYYLNNPSELSSLDELLTTYNLKVVSVMGLNDFAVGKDKLREEIDKTIRQIEFAHRIDAEFLRVFTSHIPDQYIQEEMYAQVIDCLRNVGDEAENVGVKLVIENHGGMTASAEQVRYILSEVNDENVALNLDPANFAVSGQDPVEATRELSGFTVHTHLKDCIKTDKGYRFCEVGAGEIDYHEILKVLKENGFKGYFSLEYEDTLDPERGTRQGLMNLRKILRDIG